MPSVTLTEPVTHDEEDLVAGDVIPNLTEKEAKRLVALGVATMGESVTVDDGKESDPTPIDLTPEQMVEIRGMKKDELLAALKESGVECSSAENKPDLAAKLMRAWSESGGEGAGDGNAS
ncbi:MAG: hypothetical protein LUC93_03095 [Planctomycetaceae bacterium]|nr:hypothetical protein [Planctomycetaceae bacterium]